MLTKNPFRALIVALLSSFFLTIPSHAQSILRDAEIEQFLSDYALPVFDAAGLPSASVDIHIVGDPTLNAFVSNGLNMFIFTGLITAADTPNQIEGVIAHETGHMAGGHLQRSDTAIQAATRPIMLSLVLGAVAVLAGSPEAGAGILGLGQQIGTANFLSYSRGQESSADQAGITFLEKIGHSGDGLVGFFGKLRNQQLIAARKPNPYAQTHPLANSRMAALQRRVDASPYQTVADSPAEMYRLKMIQAKIHGFVQPPQTTMRQYPLVNQSNPARYARAVAYYRGAELDKALKEIDFLIGEEPKNPFFQELKGQMLFEHGKVQASIAPHARSVELGPPYALLKINLGRALVATEEPALEAKAIQILRAALNQEPNNTFGWRELARAYSGVGRDDMAALATAEAYYNARILPEAHRFATRASKLLPKGTPEWRQANDIIQASQDAAEKARRRG